jgi:hypothetical protein
VTWDEVILLKIKNYFSMEKDNVAYYIDTMEAANLCNILPLRACPKNSSLKAIFDITLKNMSQFFSPLTILLKANLLTLLIGPYQYLNP